MSALFSADRLPGALAALAGCRVARFVVDDSLTLTLLAPGREATLRIDGRGRVQQDGSLHAFCPDSEPASLGPVLALLHQRVEHVALGADGCLELLFEGAIRFTALPEDHNIAWSVQVAGAGSASCIAEGRVVWE